MPNNSPEEPFPPEIQAAFRDYDSPPLSPAFEARFWTQWEARRGRYRGLGGALRRVWELEIEGVAVWRLALSTLSGGAVCALVLGVTGGFPGAATAPISSPTNPLPVDQIPGATMTAFAFYRRDWQELPEFQRRFKTRSQAPVAPPRVLKNGSDFSWNGSNAPLA